MGLGRILRLRVYVVQQKCGHQLIAYALSLVQELKFPNLNYFILLSPLTISLLDASLNAT